MSRIIPSALAGLAIAALALPAAAWAHVQVSPTTAAPDDSVRFEVLVPNERSQKTVEVALKVPPGVLPFSFERTPGWTRSLKQNPDGSLAVIRWRGMLDSDGFARFSFLASTPTATGPIAWKTIQTYSDGKQSAWIGAPGSDNPAPVTVIEGSAPKSNAGGEGTGGHGSDHSASGARADGPDSHEGWSSAEVIGVGVGTLALVLAGAALVVALRRRHPD